ncbi:MAG: CDP-alcohol phosphatidyltransferase family protein [Pseudomonas sp.]|uniref:CDP-alcohol phosphatidyltransferase family protein n=1 Tax=Pseudomonas sp. TaxID=306 RepID=UPI00339A9796
MKLIGVYNPPTLVTLAGLLCGFGACWLSFAGRLELAVVALIWAGIFDLFDGLVARRTQMTAREAAFGVQIDSIVDMVSFGVAPVLVAIGFGLGGVFGLIAGLLYVCAAAQRLAFFNVLQEESHASSGAGLTCYTGLPVTFAALIFGALLMLCDLLSPALFGLFLPLLLILVGGLFVYPLRIPKPRGAAYLVFPVLACLLTAYWLVR